MNLSFFLARRYFSSKRKRTFINVISIISMVAIAFGTTALVIVLSVFNGIEGLLRSLFNSFDPELKVEVVEGKSFTVDEAFLNKIESVPGVAVVTEIIEDNVYVQYQDAGVVVTMKGVGDSFLDQHRIDHVLVEGEMRLKEESRNYAIIGLGLQNRLSAYSLENFRPLKFFYPKGGRIGSLDPSSHYRQRIIALSGVFSIEKQYDENYVFVPLDFAADLLEYGNKRTSLEVKAEPSASISEVQQKLKETLGDAFLVLNGDEQHQELLKAIKIEKLFIFLVFGLILAVASFNIFFSLTMLVLDKKKDISVLYASGATDRLIRSVFIKEGVLIAAIGTVSGLFLGFLICWVQQRFGFVSMGLDAGVIDAYPIKMETMDFLYTALGIFLIAFLASLRPAVMATRFNFLENL